MDRAVTLAAITGAHGVTGEVRLKLFGEGVAALRRYRAFNDSALTLEKLGITDQRMRDAMMRAVSAGDMLSESISRSPSCAPVSIPP